MGAHWCRWFHRRCVWFGVSQKSASSAAEVPTSENVEWMEKRLQNEAELHKLQLEELHSQLNAANATVQTHETSLETLMSESKEVCSIGHRASLSVLPTPMC